VYARARVCACVRHFVCLCLHKYDCTRLHTHRHTLTCVYDIRITCGDQSITQRDTNRDIITLTRLVDGIQFQNCTPRPGRSLSIHLEKTRKKKNASEYFVCCVGIVFQCVGLFCACVYAYCANSLIDSFHGKDDTVHASE